MSKCSNEILLSREGTDQEQRYLDALNPDSFKLNDFGLNDWMKFAFNFAQKVNYFSVKNHEIASGNWQDFFIDETPLIEFLKELGGENEVTPHLTLYICFIKLLEFSKKRFNNLTRRHLDFYYQEILQIKKLPATPDQVHLIFELAKSKVAEKIAKATQIDGGKDANGNPLIYSTNEELIVNKIKVSSLKSVYNDFEEKQIKAATVANSYDGIGGDFPYEEVKWWPFGYSSAETNYGVLPDAKIGFAIASPVFLLQEGERNVKVSVTFNTHLSKIFYTEFEKLVEEIEVYCSGEKKWLGPFTLKGKIDSINKITGIKKKSSFSPFEGTNEVVQINEEVVPGINIRKLDLSHTRINLMFQISKNEKSVVNYKQEVLGENFDTQLPVCRFLLKTENTRGYLFYHEIAQKKIIGIDIEVDVKGVKSMLLENDFGTLNAKKPFYPFGTQPVKGANFSIGYAEISQKDWSKINVNINWKNTPLSFSEHYKNYKSNAKPPIAYVKNNNYFKASLSLFNMGEWETYNDQVILFNKTIKNSNDFSTSFSLNGNSNSIINKNGPLRLSLNQSFLHEMYAKIYTTALLNSEPENIPSEPYIPMVEEISLSYRAKQSADLLVKNKTAYEKSTINFFHEHPFGQTEEHLYLKEQHSFLEENDKKIFLLPTYCKGGELYIGLENAITQQQVSLLVQVLEGSENPETDQFVGKQKVEWSMLCNNEWKNLDSNYLLSNNIDNFLKSGIVKFSIPKEATSENTLLPSKLFWLKAKIHKNYNAVCKAIAIYPQAILAEFTDNENELSHLQKGLAATSISKLINRLAEVKNITQPFNSFGGNPQENDATYYRRISERLRHKNRAINIWDYENIILQHFLEIHKVKCLNHTLGNSFLSPGNVTMVLIPDIVNKNVFDIFEPRVSKATLNEVQNHINQLNSFHVNAVAINPVYEEVKVCLKVKFHTEYDETYCLGVLNTDLIKLLSPWAFDQTANINFGVSLHISVLIDYIEKLQYVDYVTKVTLMKKISSTANFGEVKSAFPSSPMAILVSVKQHDIEIDNEKCNSKLEITKTCQT